MTQKDNGGPAFPSLAGPLSTGQTGMTLRDWFAGQALMGLMADPGVTSSHQIVAGACYRFADAMIEERSK